MQLIFRTDATSETGLGHISRCRELAHRLLEVVPGLELWFVGQLSPFACSAVEQLGARVLLVSGAESVVDGTWLERWSGTDVRVVLDHYGLTGEDLTRLTERGVLYALFDDFGVQLGLHAALVINARVTAPSLPYLASYQALGIGYFVVSPELTRTRAARLGGVAPAVRRILLCMGGTDLYGAGALLARKILTVFPGAIVDWIGAPSGAIGAERRVRALPLVPNLAPYYQSADLVVTGGGRIKYEAGYCLVPCASVSQTEGQAIDTADLAREGLCVDLGPAEALVDEVIDVGLERLRSASFRQQMTEQMMARFSGDSGDRLAQLVVEALELRSRTAEPPRTPGER